MIPTLKTIGLAALAALALSAVAASAAQAQKGTFTTGLTPATHTPSNVHTVQVGTLADNFWESNGVRISCTTTYDVTSTGEEQTKLSGTDDTLTVTPEYKACGTVNGEGQIPSHNITITTNGCDYDFNQPETIGEEQYTGTVSLNCPAEKSPEVHVYLGESRSIELCKVTIEPEQSNLSHVVYTNEANGEDPDHVKVHATIEGLKYINKKGTCPGGEVTLEDGKLEATATVTSTDGHDIWISEKEEE